MTAYEIDVLRRQLWLPGVEPRRPNPHFINRFPMAAAARQCRHGAASRHDDQLALFGDAADHNGRDPLQYTHRLRVDFARLDTQRRPRRGQASSATP